MVPSPSGPEARQFDGRLMEIMPDWRFPVFDMSLADPGNRRLPQPVRVFQDFT